NRDELDADLLTRRRTGDVRTDRHRVDAARRDHEDAGRIAERELAGRDAGRIRDARTCIVEVHVRERRVIADADALERERRHRDRSGGRIREVKLREATNALTLDEHGTVRRVRREHDLEASARTDDNAAVSAARRAAEGSAREGTEVAGRRR